MTIFLKAMTTLTAFTMSVFLLISCNSSDDSGSILPPPSPRIIKLERIDISAAPISTRGVSEVTLAAGNSQPFVAIGHFSDGSSKSLTDAVFWHSSNKNVGVMTDAVLEARSVGQTEVFAVLNGITSNKVTVEVTDAVITSIQVTPPQVSLAKGQTQQLTATASYSDRTSSDISSHVAWKSADNNTAAVTTDGVLTGVATGTTTVEASQDGIISNTVKVKVTDAVITAIQVTPSQVSLAKGLTQQLTATATYSDRTSSDISSHVTWKPADPSVVSLSPDGVLTAAAIGSTTVKATKDGISSSPVKVEVVDAIISSIQVTPPQVSLAKGQTQQLTATATYSDRTSSDISSHVTWKPADPSVVTLSPDGILTAVATGSTTVQASQDGISSNTVKIEVTDAIVTSIQVTPAKVSLVKGETQRLLATAIYSDSTTADLTSHVAWISADPNTVTVSPEGIVTAVATGSTTVEATQDGVSSNSVDVEVADAVIASIQVTPPQISLAKGQTQQLMAIATYTDSTSADVTSRVTWILTEPNTATVSPDGVLTAVEPGSTTVQATQDGVNSNTVKIKVTDAVVSSIQVSPLQVLLPIGETQQLTATATYSNGTTADITNSVAWASTDPGITTVSPEGVLTGVAIGSTAVNASQGGITSNTVNIKVTDVVISSIQVTPTQVSLAKGETQQLTATATFSDSTTANITHSATWISAHPSTATVSVDGILTGVATGSTSVSASQKYISSNVVAVEVTDAALSSIQVTPSQVSLAKGGTKQLTATATYTDSTTSDITNLANWISADTDIAIVNSAGILTGVVTGSTTIKAAHDGITSNIVDVQVTGLAIPVCGHVTGYPIDTSSRGGVNNANLKNAVTSCLKIREVVDPNDKQTKWFASSPSVTLMQWLGYTIDDSDTNSGDTYAGTYAEDGTDGPAGEFARFRQDGKGVSDKDMGYKWTI